MPKSHIKLGKKKVVQYSIRGEKILKSVRCSTAPQTPIYARMHTIPIIAHDIGNCFTIDRNYIVCLAKLIAQGELIASTPEVTTEIKNIFAALEQNRLQKLVLLDDLKTYGSEGNSRFSLKLERINPMEIIDSIACILDETMLEPGRTITVDTDSTKRTIVSDASRINQIVTNLIMNAIRHAVPSDIHVSARFVTIEGIESFVLVVEDKGPGIPKEDMERIFQPFEQSHQQDSNSKVGDGLGLYIVRHLVDSLQASIELQSDVGKGARFVVRFPLDANDKENTPSS